MEFQELITQRYSVRAYKPDDIPSDKLDKILEAARLAPTANTKVFKKYFLI
jgi:nitroreductase